MTDLHPERVERTDRDDLADALVQTAFIAMAALNRIGAENDLSLTQLRVLAILRDRRLSMTVLAGYLGLEKSTMTGLIARAEKRGLIRRAPSENDGRIVEVFLSSGGAELSKRLTPRLAASLESMTDVLSAAERRRILALLERMLARPSEFLLAQGGSGTRA